MSWKWIVASVAAMLTCLVGWAALASAQPIPGLGEGPQPPAMRADVPPPPGFEPPQPLPLPAGGALPNTPPVPTPAEFPPPPLPAPDVPPAPGGTGLPIASPPPGGSTVPDVLPPPGGAGLPDVPPPPGGAGLPTETPEGRTMPPATVLKPIGDYKMPAEASVTADNPAGRQEPAVSIEWGGTPVAKVGQVGEYSLIVRNICNGPVQQTTVRVRVPDGLQVVATEPKSTVDSGLLVWDLGTLTSRQERVLGMKLKATSKGDLAPVAWVTFTGTSSMKIRVREPKLTVKVMAPEKALVGDQAQFSLSVTNPGDGSADQVRIQAVLSEGLEHPRGSKIDFEIGSIAAGETRNVALLCATRTGGVQTCEATVTSDCGLTAKDTGSMNVIMPRLDLKLVGPRLRYLDRKAIYSLTVTNPGDAPATNVTVSHVVPAGFKVLAASDGGRHDYQTRTVSWFLGEVGAGKTREVKVEVQAISPGDHMHRASAVGARGLRAEAELPTKVEGIAALLVELVDTEDPIEANGDTSYQVRISNTGSKTEENIKLIATIPDKMQFKNAAGPVRYQEEGKTVVFEPIQRLAPRADALFRINVKALESGTVRFKIQVTSLNLTLPVVKMEATRIYSDAEPAPMPAGLPDGE